ncbi:MAG: histidinol-phosphate transaminase [Deltaproteobacteria bacterium]|nr:histidinol-phosphate transaminase [Deltaproteobacteria bacterium]
MNKYWSSIVKNIKPYTPGEQPKDKKYIKLNTNENPYPPSPRVIAAIKEAANEDLKLYPDPNCDALKAAIAQRYALTVEEIFTGNGSDEILAFTFLAFFDPGKTIIFPDISYSFYPVYANLFQVPYDPIPLREDFSLPIESFDKPNSGIVIANPNAPTGKYLPIEYIRTILEHNMNSAVILDEAYIAFGGESAIKLVSDFPNLLVIHTLSKSHSLAGLRVAYAVGNRGLILALERIKNSINNYTLDRLAITGAIEAIKDDDYFLATRAKIIRTRERVYGELLGMGFQCIESKANFLFISNPRIRADFLFKELRQKGILVRYFNLPRIENHLRVTIGSDEEMDFFLTRIKEIISD